MKIRAKLSARTRNYWLLDSVLFISAVIASLSGIYFLVFPVAGYQGGRNPWYEVVILFTRHTWDDLHTWGGIVMIIIAIIHISLHWKWFVKMIKRTIKEIFGKGLGMNIKARYNLWLNIVAAVSFFIVSISGLYFLFIPGAAHSSAAADPMLLFNRAIWDVVHTWSGVVLIIAGVLHFDIHWRWITKVTKNIFRSLFQRQKISKETGLASAN